MENFETYISFTQVNSEHKTKIDFAWGEYNSIKIHFVAGLKGFNIVENIIHQYSREPNDYTIRKKLRFPSDSDLNSVLFDKIYPNTVDIDSEIKVEKFSKLVQEFYNNDLSEFFNKYSKLTDVKSRLEQTEIGEHKNLLVVNRNLMMIRKLVILKETDSNDFDNLYSKYSKFLIEKANETPYREMNKTFNNFKPYFE